jgi:protein-S-isoprenylcysteine O-methyltransferase Ste14
MGLCAVLAAAGIARRRPWGLLFGLMTGGCLVYLGCLDVLFNVNAGNYGIASAPMGAEIVINAGSFAIGAVLIAWCWRHREALLRR